MSTKYFAIILALLFVSCGPSDFEKYMEDYKECAENKKEEKGYKYANIQEALNAYDFEVARDYLACHPTKDCFNDEGDQTSCKGWGVEKRPYLDDLNLIVTAEITYFISEGEFKKAESVAKEANLMEVYNKIAGQGFEENLDELIDMKDFKKIHSYLTDMRFEYQKTTYNLNSSPGNSTAYQDKVREFNAILDKVLSKYSFENVEAKYLKQVIDLALPGLEAKKGDSYSSVLVDTYKKEATAKYMNK